MTEREAMQRALELAMNGWGRVAPNPLVGAVVLRDGTVIGEGYHAEFGGPHAEIAALAQCRDPKDATCVVSLEPCTHHGKTPPCVDALVNAGVARVVIAMLDPTAQAGGGARLLRERGIDVAVGLEAHQAAALNASFLWNAARPELPFVTLKVATSLDGFLTDADRTSRWISGEEGRRYVHWLRAGYDAVAVGRVTAVEDDPELTVRGPVSPRIPPVRVVFTRSGEVPRTLTLVQTAREIPTCIVVQDSHAQALEEAMRGTGVTVLSANTLTDGLRRLKKNGINSLLVEGGGGLATAMLEEKLVDRLVWVQAPIWLNQGVRAFGHRSAVTLEAAKPWTVTDRRTLGRDTLLVLDRELCLPVS